MQILLFQIITNAAKNTETGTITITCEEINGFVNIKISDEGIGMNPILFCEKQKQININSLLLFKSSSYGMYIINDMLSILNATIYVFENKPKGTTIEISLRK